MLWPRNALRIVSEEKTYAEVAAGMSAAQLDNLDAMLELLGYTES